MAKCLRCSAGAEWIQGSVPSEPNHERDKEALRKKRELTGRWHDKAVSLGFDGVEQALHELEAFVRRQRMRADSASGGAK